MNANRFGLATLTLLATAACGGSPLPAPDFPKVPPAAAEHARYGVVTLREATITMKDAAAGGGSPTIPAVRIGELTRTLVTGDMPADLYTRELRALDGCVITKARGRLASKGKASFDVDVFAGSPPPPSDPGQLAAYGAKRPSVVRVELPKPAVGDLIDFFVEAVCTQAFDMLPPVVFGTCLPTLDSRLTVRADPGFKTRLVISPGGYAISEAPPATDKAGVRTWTLREHDLPAIEDDAFAVNAQQLSPWAQAVIASVQSGGTEKVYAESWTAIAARVRQAAEPASPAGTPDGEAVKSGSATSRLRKLRDRMAPKVARALFAPARRYSDIPSGGVTPFEAAAAIVMATRDAPDRGFLALATLADGPLLIDGVPSLYPFRAVLVASRANGGWQFDDPTCVNCAVGRLPSDLTGGRAMVITNDGYEITEVPFGATETSRERLQLAWTLKGEELTGTVLADFEGGVARRLALLMDQAAVGASSEGLSMVRAALFGAGSGLEVVSISEASSPHALPYEMRFVVAAKTDSASGSVRMPIYRVIGPWVPWVTPVTEPRDIVLPGPLRSEVIASITLPRAHALTRLGDVNVRKTVGEYTLHVEQRDDTVTITRRVGLFTRHVPRERFAELRELVLAAAEADSQLLELNAGR